MLVAPVDDSDKWLWIWEGSHSHSCTGVASSKTPTPPLWVQHPLHPSMNIKGVRRCFHLGYHCYQLFIPVSYCLCYFFFIIFTRLMCNYFKVSWGIFMLFGSTVQRSALPCTNSEWTKYKNYKFSQRKSNKTLHETTNESVIRAATIKKKSQFTQCQINLQVRAAANNIYRRKN